MEEENAVFNHPDITFIVEFIKNRLYFATLHSGKYEIINTEDILPFCIDHELVYKNFYNDFGPLNLACLYKYCCIVNEKLNNPAHVKKQIVHYTFSNPKKRANAAYLISSYAVLYLHKTPKESYELLVNSKGPTLKSFQDASVGSSIYKISLLDCLNALKKAVTYGFVNFEDFDVNEYDKYEHMRKGDLNWLLPQKFIAFLGPSTEAETLYHPPERYINYFNRNNVVAVVRLSRKTYSAYRFINAGIKHYDMFIPDGGVPSPTVLQQFLHLAESTNGAIAVHCKAGLGRTGSLIAAYLVKHYRMTAKEAVAWTRICRPGSVTGHQQTWLEDMEASLWQEGEQYSLKNYGSKDKILYYKRGIYSRKAKLEKRNQFHHITNDEKLLHRVEHVANKHGISEVHPTQVKSQPPLRRLKHKPVRSVEKHMSQGDRLNEIKMARSKLQSTSRVKSTYASLPSNSTKGYQKKNNVNSRKREDHLEDTTI